MASTQMLSSNSLAVKLFEKKTWIQVIQKTTLGHMFNRKCVYFPEELMGKDATGDQVTYPYSGKLINIPIGEGGTLDGNEEALNLKSHSLAMNISRIAVLSPDKDTIEQQRTKVNFSKTGIDSLKRRCMELLDSSLWNHLAGFNPSSAFTLNGTTYTTAADKLHVQGHNTPTDPTTNRIIRAGKQANDESLTSSDIMSLDLIDFALEKISTSDQPIEMLDGETFDLYLSPEQMVDLQQNSSANIKWFDLQFSKLAGDQDDAKIETNYKNNMICAGKYRNVLIYQAPRIPNGISSADGSIVANTKRGVLVGIDALSFASPYGGRITDTDVPMKMYDQKKDYTYFKGQESRLLYGLKKMSPTEKEDIGSFVISTFAASHS